VSNVSIGVKLPLSFHLREEFSMSTKSAICNFSTYN